MTANSDDPVAVRFGNFARLLATARASRKAGAVLSRAEWLRLHTLVGQLKALLNERRPLN